MNEERLSGALQENILTLLCYDDTAARTIRASIPAHLFESKVFKEVAGLAIDFLDQFGVAIKEHLADSLENVLNGDDTRKARLYKSLLDNLHLAKDSVNSEYVLKQLHKFLRQQTMKAAVIRAVEAIEDGDIDTAEVELQKGLSVQATNFDPGLTFSDTSKSLAFFDEQDKGLLTGIEELDRRGIGPKRKEQFVVLAPSNVGKSWALTHLGKFALLQRQMVVHITLEMSEQRVAQRYVQSWFSISRRDSVVRVPMLSKARDGTMEDVTYEDIERETLMDPGIRSKIAARMSKRFAHRPPLIIKEFPTGMLTIPMLNAYLDSLERLHKIVPDVLIIDYPELMDLSSKSGDMRLAIGDINRKLRGIAVERNMMQITAGQANREGAKARMVEATHAGEDYSKIQTADTVMTLTQTRAERKLGLMRAYVDKVRNEDSKFVTLMTQALSMGQFCLDSCAMHGDAEYFNYVNKGYRDDDE